MSGFGGGGYMAGGGGFLMQSRGAQDMERPEAPTMKQRITPVTVKQVMDAEHEAADEAYKVNGAALSTVTMVGVIESVESLSTNMEMVLNDFTGSICMKFWIEQDEKGFKVEQRMSWQPGTFVRAYGNVQSLAGQTTLIAIRIKPLEDFNEFTFHHLEVVQSFLHQTKGLPTKGSGTNTKMNTAAPSSNYGASVGVYNGASIPAAANDLANYVKACPTTPTGVPKAEMINALKGQYSEAQVNEAIEYLHHEGHLYSTIDEEHFSYCAA